MATTSEEPIQYEEVPPSQAPQLVPWNENSSFLSPGGAVAGISAFADSATSPGRSRAARVFIRVVVALVLVSIILGGVWQMSRSVL